MTIADLDLSRTEPIAATHARPRFRNTLSRMMRMSWPLMLGAAIMALMQFGQAGLLGNLADRQPLFLLSMLQPWYLLFFAILEALAVTSQVFSAKSCAGWPPGGGKIAVPVLSAFGLLVIGALALGVHLAGHWLATRFGVIDGSAVGILPGYLLTLAPFLLFEVLNGSLRGRGRTLPGFLVLAVAAAVNLGLCDILILRRDLGIEGLFLANLASGVAATVLILPVAVVAQRGGGRAPLVPSLMRTAKLLAVVGLPVFLSMVVSFFSSSVLFLHIARFGTQYASGFLLAVRIRLFFLIPATALATALAVLVNQEDALREAGLRRGQLVQGGATAALLYAAITGAFYALRVPLVDLLTDAPEVRAAAVGIIDLLLPSYFVVALVIFIQIILENLGRGARVLVWTVLLEGGTCAALIFYAATMRAALYTLLAAAAGYLVIFLAEYLLLIRSQAAGPDRNGGQRA